MVNPRVGLAGCVIMRHQGKLFNPQAQYKGALMKTMAYMLMLLAVAGSQPAGLLHTFVHAMTTLLKLIM